MVNNISVFSDPNDIFFSAEKNTINAISIIFQWFLTGQYEDETWFLKEQLNHFIKNWDIPPSIAERLEVIIQMFEDQEQNKALLESFRYTAKKLIRRNEWQVITEDEFRYPVKREIDRVLLREHRTTQQRVARKWTWDKPKDTI